MPAKVLMVQGTASSAGKSMLVTALCRIFRQEGYNVAPFKAQNMSLNSYVTRDGGEMGRAQVVQAEAAMVEPTVDMNPILLKPEADHRSQVILRGRVLGSFSAREYYEKKMELWQLVTESLDNLRCEHDLVVIEGAGSPAEINLREQDIVNMRVALYAQAPVLLVGDIERGGVFASLVGTLELLQPEERALIKGVVINKFRGDLSLLKPGIAMLEARLNTPVCGVVPYFRNISIADEDSVSLEGRQKRSSASSILNIAVVRLPHISNFDDFNPLEEDDGVSLRYVRYVEELEEPDLIILPGTKTTVEDLRYIRESGLASRIVALTEKGTPLIGICGGYQMLGEWLYDPEHIESAQERTLGLGLLPVTTQFASPKETHQVKGRVVAREGILRGLENLPFEGYEIHMGRSNGKNTLAPFLITERSQEPCQTPDGAISGDGNILGTYVHGLFHNHTFRRGILANLAARKGVSLPERDALKSKDRVYDELAEQVRRSLDMPLIHRIAGLEL